MNGDKGKLVICTKTCDEKNCLTVRIAGALANSKHFCIPQEVLEAHDIMSIAHKQVMGEDVPIAFEGKPLSIDFDQAIKLALCKAESIWQPYEAIATIVKGPLEEKRVDGLIEIIQNSPDRMAAFVAAKVFLARPEEYASQRLALTLNKILPKLFGDEFKIDARAIGNLVGVFVEYTDRPDDLSMDVDGLTITYKDHDIPATGLVRAILRSPVLDAYLKKEPTMRLNSIMLHMMNVTDIFPVLPFEPIEDYGGSISELTDIAKGVTADTCCSPTQAVSTLLKYHFGGAYLDEPEKALIEVISSGTDVSAVIMALRHMISIAVRNVMTSTLKD